MKNNGKSKKHIRIFETPDGRKFIKVPCPKEANTDIIVPYEKPVELTEEEESKANALGFDLKRVLTVKRLLSKELGPTAIQKQTGISRSTVNKYKKYLFSKSAKIREKSTKNTVISKSGFSNLLIFSTSGSETTNTYFIIPGLLLLMVVWLIFKIIDHMHQKAKLDHMREYGHLRNLFYRALDYSYLRYPIICNSEKEERYYKDILIHYNNQGRYVASEEYQLSDTSQSHRSRKNNHEQKIRKNNKFDIIQAQERYSQKFREIANKGLLDCLHFPQGPNSIESEKFIRKAIQYLVDNPEPNCNDRSRKKYVEEIAKQHTNQDTKIRPLEISA